MTKTLCVNCDTSVFNKCPYVHGWKSIKGMKTDEFILVSKKGEKTKMKRVTYCPEFKKQAPRKCDKENSYTECAICGKTFMKKTGRKTCSTECANKLMSVNRRKKNV